MNDPLKYLVVKVNGCEHVIVFSAILDHWQVAGGANVRSAGFCRIYGTEDGGLEVSCWGGSTTLEVESRPEDSELLSRELNRAIK